MTKATDAPYHQYQNCPRCAAPLTNGQVHICLGYLGRDWSEAPAKDRQTRVFATQLEIAELKRRVAEL